MDAAVREEVRLYAMALGFDLVGFAGAEPFQQEESILWERQAEGYRSPLEEPDIHRRVHPQELLPGAATIVAVAVNFSGGAGAVPPDDVPRGSISLHPRGPDYHRILGPPSGPMPPRALESSAAPGRWNCCKGRWRTRGTKPSWPKSGGPLSAAARKD